MNKKKLKFVIGGLLILGVAVWIFGSISSENLTYYYTPSEVIEQYETLKEDTVRVMGVVKKQSINWNPQETKLVFEMSDDHEHFVKVEYQGAKPDMFKEGQGVVIEGRFSGPGHLVASALLVKHSEEYQTSDHNKTKEDYYQSLQ